MAKSFTMAQLKELLDIHENDIINFFQIESKTWNKKLQVGKRKLSN